MTSKTLRGMLVLLPLVLVLLITQRSGSTQQRALPNPVLYLTSSEPHQSGGKQFIRYRYDVFNKDAYPADFFAASPNLPPCGKDTKAARTSVDFYDQNGKRLNEFCALKKPSDLNGIWFAIEAGTVPPSWVYIELNDRLTNTKYKSNLAETTD